MRLAGQRLDRPAPRAALIETAGAVGGIQAQVASAGRLSLAVRVSGATDRAIEKALTDERSLAKIWTVRGTLHFVPSEEVSLHAAAFGPIRLHFNDQWLARSGLDATTKNAACDDVVEALGKGPLSRREIAETVGDRHGSDMQRWILHSWGGLLRRIFYDGRAVFGPVRGTEVTFVRAKDWLPEHAHTKRWERADAEAEMARRFLRAYGPVHARDFGFWAGLYAPDARAIAARVEEERVEVKIEGAKAPAYVHRDALDTARRGRRSLARTQGADPHVLLLPHFDTYLLGHRDKATFVEKRFYKRVFRTAGWVSPVVLVDGRVAGTWSGERKKDRFEVALAPFGRWPRTLRPLVGERAREMGERLGLEGRLARGRR